MNIYDHINEQKMIKYINFFIKLSNSLRKQPQISIIPISLGKPLKCCHIDWVWNFQTGSKEVLSNFADWNMKCHKTGKQSGTAINIETQISFTWGVSALWRDILVWTAPCGGESWEVQDVQITPGLYSSLSAWQTKMSLDIA